MCIITLIIIIIIVHGRFILSASFQADPVTLFPISDNKDDKILGRNDKRCDPPREFHEKEETKQNILTSVSHVVHCSGSSAVFCQFLNSFLYESRASSMLPRYLRYVLHFCKIDGVYLLHLL